MDESISHPFLPADLEAIRHHGMSVEAAARQIERLRMGSMPISIDRPATVGDGIERADGREGEWERVGVEAIARGRCGGFVPASGAATRMFLELIQAWEEPGTTPESDAVVAHFLDALPRFALCESLAHALTAAGLDLDRLVAARDARPIFETLFSPTRLGYANLPKALVPFHRDERGVRTALEEHVEDAVATMADADGTSRLHFTVPYDCRRPFETTAAARAAALEREAGVRVELSLSSQFPATDCLAATLDGAPLRDEGGVLVFRPGGHGALLPNLAASGGDLVLLKNIDNVAATPYKGPTYQWVPRLFGHLAALEREALALLDRLDDLGDGGPWPTPSGSRARLGLREDLVRGDARAHFRHRLDRPLRVCGMVPNAGEPGGGPYWVRHADGVPRLQILETAQLKTFGPAPHATHFNPVFMVCALRDRRHRPHPLDAFVDEDAVIVTRKWAGQPLLALERPGLWNGAMAKEHRLPRGAGTIFTPVKRCSICCALSISPRRPPADAIGQVVGSHTAPATRSSICCGVRRRRAFAHQRLAHRDGHTPRHLTEAAQRREDRRAWPDRRRGVLEQGLRGGCERRIGHPRGVHRRGAEPQSGEDQGVVALADVVQQSTVLDRRERTAGADHRGATCPADHVVGPRLGQARGIRDRHDDRPLASLEHRRDNLLGERRRTSGGSDQHRGLEFPHHVEESEPTLAARRPAGERDGSAAIVRL
jgi:hypothetical protein